MTVGRPCLLNEERKAAILEAIADDATEEAAAWAAGICSRTLCEWKSIGEKDLVDGNDTEFSQLLLAIRKVRQASMRQKLRNIKDAATQPEYWTANAWLLERLWRRHFGKDADLYEEVKKEQDEIKALLKQLLEKKEIPNG